MAMLAEPRRKQKVINLRAKHSAWSNDNTKFGQRMLEKMGWTSGKGLGANENGITEHVVARYKNDDKGLGFEDRNDQWTKHEDDFNAVLANLSSASDNTEVLHSGISLEDKSKKSKARIHYHKFTRGKDISKYSEKDLANIFGKKSFRNIEKVQEDLIEDIKTTEQVFTEKGSMEDYFKNKLASIKSKSKLSISNGKESDADCNDPSYDFRGFVQETNDTEFCIGLGYNQEDKSTIDKFTMNYSGCYLEKLKKKKKSSNTDISENADHSSNNIQHEDLCQNQTHGCSEGKIKKKKSKNKNKIEHLDNEGQEKSIDQLNGEKNSTPSVSVLDQFLKKKKNSKKDKVSDDTSQHININNFNGNEDQGQLSSNKKNKQHHEEIIVPGGIIKKKKSKRKNIEDATPNIANVENDIPNKKKKRKEN